MKPIAILAPIIALLYSMSAHAAGGGSAAPAAADPNLHFDPLGKPPSEHSLKAIKKDSADLPFDDKRDFDEAKKGFIAEPDSWKVLGPEGNVVWDLDRYDFFRSGKDFPSVHPSLQRVSQLNMKVGLFEVIPGFYQVRGYDLANITFVKGKTGWIVFDPLTAPEPAAAAILSNLLQYLADFTKTFRMVRWMMGGLAVVGYDLGTTAGVDTFAPWPRTCRRRPCRSPRRRACPVPTPARIRRRMLHRRGNRGRRRPLHLRRGRGTLPGGGLGGGPDSCPRQRCLHQRGCHRRRAGPQYSHPALRPAGKRLPGLFE